MDQNYISMIKIIYQGSKLYINDQHPPLHKSVTKSILKMHGNDKNAK